ncbi:hypothetical protein B0H10DRAFT_2355166 [Mycena sp. CBHHK59/15]|nr:hypothetical protein B0H10DRAFT_2355166 [Mycena sp. CBHHK59/15]
MHNAKSKYSINDTRDFLRSATVTGALRSWLRSEARRRIDSGRDRKRRRELIQYEKVAVEEKKQAEAKRKARAAEKLAELQELKPLLDVAWIEANHRDIGGSEIVKQLNWHRQFVEVGSIPMKTLVTKMSKADKVMQLITAVHRYNREILPRLEMLALAAINSGVSDAQILEEMPLVESWDAEDEMLDEDINGASIRVQYIIELIFRTLNDLKEPGLAYATGSGIPPPGGRRVQLQQEHDTRQNVKPSSEGIRDGITGEPVSSVKPCRQPGKVWVTRMLLTLIVLQKNHVNRSSPRVANKCLFADGNVGGYQISTEMMKLFNIVQHMAMDVSFRACLAIIHFTVARTICAAAKLEMRAYLGDEDHSEFHRTVNALETATMAAALLERRGASNSAIYPNTVFRDTEIGCIVLQF